MRPSAYLHGRGRTIAVVRGLVGLWLLALGAYLSARGIWLGLLFVIPAAGHFYLAYRAMEDPER